jgi:hypothetical protein
MFIIVLLTKTTNKKPPRLVAVGAYFLHPHPFLAVFAGFFAAGFFAFPFAVAMVILLCMV